MTGNHDLRSLIAANPVFLAPMAGVNDPVFREICKLHGAGLTYTEMISAQGLAHASKRTQQLLDISSIERPAAVQLFGSDPAVLASQAQIIEQHYGDSLALIDINMGCPMRKIAGKGEGAALIQDMPLAGRILTAVVNQVHLPVTVKIRKGFELNDDDAVEFAKMAEDCGVAAIAVHGRTARQLYHGTSDKDVIRRVKAAVDIPVLASGDVFEPEDVQSYLMSFGADGVLVARGAQGNPWIFERTRAYLADDLDRAQAEVTIADRVSVASAHLQGISQRYPQRLSSMRKHFSWYFKGTAHASDIRRTAHTCQTPEEYQCLLNDILERSEND